MARKWPSTFAAVAQDARVGNPEVGDVAPKAAEDAVRHAGLLPEPPWTGIYAKITTGGEPIFSTESPGLITACGVWARVYLPHPVGVA
ncbi:hypothetical protein [Mycobacterium sp. 852002-51961_SCH5331710]|uniref:hypothetical protein n=1 Tax=Mycobacterium sp. 852002-51961_SCH5331710 TaxID=1834105 RepID=UPI0007FE5223|nr:hypothetical protein [Mycobacterium sp. 852002-51961_SCH5331710]OBB36555.1 hypothetical protein A5752_15595 [Mycobacterium sp. 852002-51961_SCH5331710]